MVREAAGVRAFSSCCDRHRVEQAHSLLWKRLPEAELKELAEETRPDHVRAYVGGAGSAHSGVCVHACVRGGYASECWLTPPLAPPTVSAGCCASSWRCRRAIRPSRWKWRWISTTTTLRMFCAVCNGGLLASRLSPAPPSSFARECEFTPEKTSAYMTIMGEALTRDRSDGLRTMEGSFKDFKTALLAHAVERPPARCVMAGVVGCFACLLFVWTCSLLLFVWTLCFLVSCYLTGWCSSSLSLFFSCCCCPCCLLPFRSVPPCVAAPGFSLAKTSARLLTT